MLLALDAGNTNIKIGAFEQGKLIWDARLRTVHEQTADEYGVMMRNLFQLAGLDTKPPLTPREREVLHWLAEGKRDGEIAMILRVSVRTIEQHVRACLQKVGVETRTAAVAAVWRARMK